MDGNEGLMQTTGPYYIGQKVTIASLRNWILETELIEGDALLVHPNALEGLLEEYRETYKEPMPDPYFILGILIDETTRDRLPVDNVMIVRNDDTAKRYTENAKAAEVDDESPIYRCGWCGNVVDEDGSLFSPEVKLQEITRLERRGGTNVSAVHGHCCPNGHG